VASSPEDTVRDYLRYVADPASVRPDTSDIDARIEQATDPVERVKLRSERSRLQDVGPTLEAAFIAEAAAWARDNDVDPDALLAEGVERRVLVEAGLLAGAPRRTSRARDETPAKPRAKRVSRDDIEAYVRGLRKGTTFTTATVAADAGGSPATVRKVIDALTADGVVVEDGKDHSGPGRPRTLYQRT
jgi:hypothetical protein